jgi:tetratricopeptide (TPR) repeat protein
MAASATRPDVEALRLLRSGKLQEAREFAVQAVAGAGTCLPAHGLLATILLRLGYVDEAERTVAEALERSPGVADAYDALAFVSMQLGRHERANTLYRRAVELAPGDPRFWYNLASSERAFGRLEEAASACDRAIALDAAQYPSYLLRSELRVQTAGSNHIGELQRQLSLRPADDRAQMFLGYALAKELDDVERYDEAFGWFSHAAATRRRHLAYDVAVDERKLERIAAAFSAQAMPKSVEDGQSARYIFILGLPRSGTTLLERILTGLPGVRSNGETENFSRALLAVAPSEGADVFARAAGADPEAVGAHYGRLAGGRGHAHVIEKMPLNYLYLGAIRRALPEAKLLLVRRSPLDSCFAMYRTLFGEAYPFSYDFEDLARYYAAYERLIAHWLREFGDRIHEVVYEELVHSPAQIGAAVAKRCGVPWDASAVDVQNNAAVSLTASAAQVRRPIYGSSSGRWRYYRQHLAPLIASLREHGVQVPDDV